MTSDGEDFSVYCNITTKLMHINITFTESFCGGGCKKFSFGYGDNINIYHIKLVFFFLT